ncbi:ion channel domain-containing protein [Phthorimaea operculella]|nr:ion channel domain-containing protein [Phthorimaea operculella]
MSRRKRKDKRLVDYLRAFIAFLFSNVGVVVLVVAYTIAGAFIFQALEGASEMDRLNLMDKERDSTAQTLWLTFLNANRVGNTTQEIKSSIDEVLRSYQKKVVDAINYHGWDGSNSNLQWSFSSAFLYSLTVITTIGYGHLSPRTNWGKVVTIFYSLLGMPLFLLYLTNVGELLARWCKWLYALICLCRGCPGFSRRRIIRLRNQFEISDAESIERPEHWTIHPYLDSIDRPDYRNPDVRHQDFRNTYEDCSSRYPDYRSWNRYQGDRNYDRYPGRLPPRRVLEREPLEAIPERYERRIPEAYQESRHWQQNGQPRRADYLRSASMPHPHFEHPRDLNRGWSEPAPRMEDDEESSEFTYVTFDAQTITVPISVCVAIMVGYLMFGSMIFGIWEKWDQLDGAYFCFISLSSIGFGDFVPGERVYTPRIETSFIVCSMYLMLGMALVAMCFNLMQEQVIHYVGAMKRAAKRAVRCCRCQKR